MADLVLASASPRRLDLLNQIGIVPVRVLAADLDEAPWAGEQPADHAKRLARDKAHAVRARLDASDDAGTLDLSSVFVLAADTVVALGRRILPKAETAAQVAQCLNLLSGRGHRVHSAISIIAPDGRQISRVVTTRVQFRRLDAGDIKDYLAAGEGEGKAGGYAIQGRAALFVRQIIGSYSGVVGLPLFETGQLLKGLGFAGGQTKA